MKRLTSSLVVCMLMLGTAACTANTETEEPPQTQEMTAEQQAQAVDDMTAPVDSLVRCMLENGMEYDPQDPEFSGHPLRISQDSMAVNISWQK